jgi:predicted ATPase
MCSLYHDKLLVLSLPLERWMWNIGKIMSMKLPDNVAICFATEIHKLSQDVQLSLQMLSLFGESTKSRYIFAIESSPFLDKIISKPLEIAAAEGLVRCHNGEYKFTHARIESAAYQMFNEEDRQRYHNLFGLCLMKYSSDLNDSNDDVLFTACDQLNFAGPSIVSNETDKLTILGCNLKATKRAVAMADFKLAEYLFSHCVLFLPVNHWEDDYDLSLELFDLAAKCAVVTTNTSSLQHFADEVARHAKCFNDKLEVSYCVMTNLVTQSKIPAAVEYGLAILTQLDEPIRSDNLAREISYTNSLIKGNVGGRLFES